MGALVLLTGCFETNSPPVASFTASPSSGNAPLSVSFNASSSYDSDGSIATYEWDFGDGGHGSGITVSHTYTTAGTYTANLVVRDNDGATAEAENNVFVATTVSYDELFRHNESYIGAIVYFRGKIIQVVNKLFGGYVWRVATGANEFFGYVGDVLWVNHDGPRFLEGDVIDLCGKVKGLKTYTAVLGNQVTIPEIDALKVDLVQ
jgi:hypothetical protein